MAFVGKLAYLVLFPGLLFVFLAGLAARGIVEGMSAVVTGGSAPGRASGLRRIVRLFADESSPATGAPAVLQWAAPAVKIVALSWISCLILGFLDGDLLLILALLLLASACDLVLVSCSSNPRVRQNVTSECAQAIGWAVPLSLVIAGVALRTGETQVSAVIRWQVANGVLVGSPAGGALAATGTGLGLLGALVAVGCLARLRPLGRGLFGDPPAGIDSDISGPPLAVLNVSQLALYFLTPLLVVTLFLAGPSSSWYEVVFWALKVAGVIVVLGIVDVVAPRIRSGRALAWSLALGGGLALVGFVLIWVGGST
jgi:formate hydrogenlyase subunit 4